MKLVEAEWSAKGSCKPSCYQTQTVPCKRTSSPGSAQGCPWKQVGLSEFSLYNKDILYDLMCCLVLCRFDPSYRREKLSGRECVHESRPYADKAAGQSFSTCRLRPLWELNDTFSGSNIRYPAYQMFTL